MSHTVEKEFYRNHIDISRNFELSEFECHGNDCCGHAVMLDTRLLNILQDVRDEIGKPMTINSGYRCPVHNKNENGSPASQHMNGLAADISIRGTGLDVAELAHKFVQHGAARVGRYFVGGFVHVSVEPLYKEGRLATSEWSIY